VPVLVGFARVGTACEKPGELDGRRRDRVRTGEGLETWLESPRKVAERVGIQRQYRALPDYASLGSVGCGM
jgi:hypothetical protein